MHPLLAVYFCAGRFRFPGRLNSRGSIPSCANQNAAFAGKRALSNRVRLFQASSLVAQALGFPIELCQYLLRLWLEAEGS